MLWFVYQNECAVIIFSGIVAFVSICLFGLFIREMYRQFGRKFHVLCIII